MPVYYLIRPDLKLDWIDLPSGTLERAVEDGASDLAGLGWEPADRQFDMLTLQLALRYGIACGKGIVISGRNLLPLTQLTELLAIKPTAGRSLPGDDLMEVLAPGWKADSQRLNDKIDQNRLRLIEEARTELAEALSTAPVDSLVLYWSSLGGIQATTA